MSTTFSIADIVADVAKLCNVPAFTATSNVTSGTVTYWVSQSVRALSALLRQRLGQDNDLIQTVTMATVPSFNLVSLPADCGEVHAIVWQKTSSDYRVLSPASLDDLESDSEVDGPWESAPRYRLEGETIALYPYSTEAETLTIYFTNHIDVSGEEIDFQGRLDADRWVTLDVAIRVLLAKQRDHSALAAEKATLETNLFSKARKRDVNQTRTIRDVRGRDLRRLSRRWD